ncbi:MAG: FtsQ-type POTRA domain-containing protein [bacterium]|nr:FtsQ-type POTRA domain-containing protein [bacterium]
MKWDPYEPHMLGDKSKRPIEIRRAIVRVFILITFFAITCGFLMIVINVWKPSSFNLTSIQCVGIQNSNKHEVEKVLKELYGTYLFDVDYHQIEKKLLQLDWIQKVVIKRHLPDGLRVEIIEEYPVASLVSERTYLLTNLGNLYLLSTMYSKIDLPVITNYSKTIHEGKNNFDISIKRLAKLLSLMKSYEIYNDLVEIRYDQNHEPHFYIGNNETEWLIGSNWVESISATDAFVSQMKKMNQNLDFVYIDAITPGFISVREKQDNPRGM